ncbi:FliA/WhiG family RNA polymerase sigma factor [Geoalkalibacter halelectricus]|uniref:FliA/WhiG family RNA polymerase sigma factor n=1 Tax=Geoalkalibacter halelectricus TaxID=2847045 RepID=A0ABY5ZI21_9BACT|nr:FliA/WhiG family RNA polymerase sigma factor [Geoalkalibacter halelectricus]MDO3378057.1 FliA/WhiG family RNA polymerase sigma factor [Geoalkalibacter halelectricus]UWZ78356.1 FliA/WhiG family RNA polymerase sigma factor [Geoalkalibacter halelectricus]
MNPPDLYYQPPSDHRTRLVEEHLPLVNFLVERMITQVPASLTREDLASAAMMGLLDAANRFDPSRGILFKTFAEHRMRGAMLDEARRTDWFSRSLRDKQTRLTRALEQLERELGRSPEEHEVAAALELDLESYRDLLTEVSHLGCVSLHQTIDEYEEGRSFIDNLPDPQAATPLENVERRELTRELAEHLERLSEKERLVISLYYYEELTQKEIAEVLAVTEGRVSQLHSQALHKLKARLSSTIKRRR